jgi:hypothetical protein
MAIFRKHVQSPHMQTKNHASHKPRESLAFMFVPKPHKALGFNGRQETSPEPRTSTISYLAAVNPKTSFGWFADSPQNRGDEVFLVFNRRRRAKNCGFSFTSFSYTGIVTAVWSPLLTTNYQIEGLQYRSRYILLRRRDKVVAGDLEDIAHVDRCWP